MLSLLDLLSTIRSVGGDAFTLTGDAQSIRFVGGTQQFSERLAVELRRRVVLGAAVREIREVAAASVISANGEWEHSGRWWPCHRPLSTRSSFTPASTPPRTTGPTPADRDDDQVQRRLQTTLLALGRPNGAIARNTGPVKIIYDNSPPDGTPGVLVGFCEGAAAATSTIRRRQAPRRRPRLTRALRLSALHPRRYLELVWAAEPLHPRRLRLLQPPRGSDEHRPRGGASRWPHRLVGADLAGVDRLHGRRNPIRASARPGRDRRRALG